MRAVRIQSVDPGAPHRVTSSARVRRAGIAALALVMVSLLACGKRPARPRPGVSAAQPPTRQQPRPAPLPGDRGWGYLKEKLVADGVPPEEVHRAFGDPRMPEFDGLTFSPYPPKEGKTMYRNFLGESGTSTARRCREAWGAELERAEKRFGVPASVCAAIMTVETQCGRNTGRSIVLHRVARLAMANDPQNLQRNINRWGAGDADIERRLRARARYLEDTFYPEVKGVFEIARRHDIDPLGLKGSSAGAFGYPQFLPTSYLRHGADGNGDGKISLYEPADAAASCANYLAQHGWRPGISHQQKRQVVWQYNRSDAYIDTVLTLASRLDGES